VETEPGELLGLSRAWAETGTPKEAFCLRLAEMSPVYGRRHGFLIGGYADGLNARSG
jgi:hypothetical protein